MASSLADKWTFLDRFIQLLRYRVVRKLIPHQCVLADLGCGDGDFLKFMHRYISLGFGVDMKVTAVDSGYRIFFKEADLNQTLPLTDNSVDIVTALAVIEHLNQPNIFVNEIFRILKPGGECILTTPAPTSKALLEFLAYKIHIISEKDIRDHKQYLNRSGIITLFEKFDSVTISYFQFGLNTLIHAKKRE